MGAQFRLSYLERWKRRTGREGMKGGGRTGEGGGDPYIKEEVKCVTESTLAQDHPL